MLFLINQLQNEPIVNADSSFSSLSIVLQKLANLTRDRLNFLHLDTLSSFRSIHLSLSRRIVWPGN